MKKIKSWAMVIYYIAVPVLFACIFYLCSLVFSLSPASDNLGAVILAVNGMLFIFTPIVVLILMRFSLLQWYVDPFAAAEIPLLFYFGMIIKQMSRGHSFASAFHIINADLANDGGEGFVFIFGLFAFAVLSTISLERVREENISYRILKKITSGRKKKLVPIEYSISGYKLIWEHDENNATSNNLYIDKVWNMKDTRGCDDVCTAVTVLSDSSFRFFTWNCFSIEMQVVDGEITCVSNVFTK